MAERTYLAEHHHFESVTEAITRGADIVPKLRDVTVFDRRRTVADTETGDTILREIHILRMLAQAYREGRIAERS